MMKWVFALVVVIGIAGCQGCNEPVIEKEKPKRVVKPANSINIGSDSLAVLTQNIDEYFASISEGRFEDYLEMVYKGAFEEEDMKEATIESMQKFADEGYINVTKSFEIKHVSPVVQNDSILVCMVVAYIDHEVYLGEKYGQTPDQIEPFIKTQYGEGRYKYNPTEMKYEVQADAKLYAITEMDSLHFTFLNEQFTMSPKTANILKYETILALKEFEASL